MVKILITGGAGNVGGALARKLVQNKNYLVVIADDLSTGSKSKLPESDHENWSFVYCNVNNYRDISELMLAYKFDYVFHYAAMVGVKRTQENPIQVLNDIEGIKNVLNLCKNTSVKRAFFSSSSEVYGEPVELPQNEDTTPLNSRVPYAVVKNVGEAFFRSFKQSFDLDYTIFRFFNTYGPNQSVDFVVAKFIALALKDEPITIYGDGSQTRTFCYVDDNIDSCVQIFEESHHLNQTINIGGADEITILDLAKLVIKCADSQSEIIHLEPLKDGDMTRRMPDNSKMRAILKRDLISIEDGINLLLKNKSFLAQIK